PRRSASPTDAQRHRLRRLAPSTMAGAAGGPTPPPGPPVAPRPSRASPWPPPPGRGGCGAPGSERAAVPSAAPGRGPPAGGGGERVAAFWEGRSEGHPVFAPPVLKHGDLVLAQTAAICHFLGRRHGLAPGDEAGAAHALELQLTIADLVDEVHDTHHPISSALHYEDQKAAAQQRAPHFAGERLPRFLGYFERVLRHNGGEVLVGGSTSHADLSLFQALEGLDYAFPRAFAKASAAAPGVQALRERVRARPRIAGYLA